jgi:nucleoside-diphosphate-sugar epimerase
VIFLTGATGYVGAHLLKPLQHTGHALRCLVLPDEDSGPVAATGAAVVRGELLRPAQWSEVGNGVDVVVHAAAKMLPGAAEVIWQTNVDGTASVVDFARRHRIPRLVYLSAVSAVYREKNVYGRSKAEAERLVRESGLAYTILRPTMIYGDGGGLHFRKLVDLIRAAPGVLPVLGPGRARLQPVWIEDVIGAVCLAVTHPNAVGKAYNVSGATVTTFDGFVDRISAVLGLRRRKLHVPLSLCRALARAAAPLLGPSSFFSSEALLGINEDAAVDFSPFRDDCGYDPIGLDEGLPRSLGAPGSSSLS